jgi:hypothetical protein
MSEQPHYVTVQQLVDVAGPEQLALLEAQIAWTSTVGGAIAEQFVPVELIPQLPIPSE